MLADTDITYPFAFEADYKAADCNRSQALYIEIEVYNAKIYKYYI
jgi:hypothetical protein